MKLANNQQKILNSKKKRKKIRCYLVGSDYAQRGLWMPVCEVWMVMPKLQWSPQYVGDVKNMDYLLEKVVIFLWRSDKRELFV